MAKDTKNTPSFNHTQDAAPEYVEVILWHRVVLALGTLVIALAGIGYLLFGWMQTAENKPDMDVVTLSPDQLEPPAAIPESTAKATTPAIETQEPALATSESEEVAAEAAPVQQPTQTESTATPKRDAKAIAAGSAELNNATQPGGQLALLEQSPAITQKIAETVAKSTAPDRYQVQTEILMPAVKRAVLTTLMRGREPGKPLQTTENVSLSNPLSLHQFVEIQGRAGDSLTYVWKRDGKVVTQVKVGVGANQWRTFGSKAIHGHQQGQWEIDVIDNRERLLVRTRFYLGA